jgi:serine/threonine protein kinase
VPDAENNRTEIYARAKHALMDKHLRTNEVLPLFGQILNSVEAAHFLGVCHRDIKPENKNL